MPDWGSPDGVISERERNRDHPHYKPIPFLTKEDLLSMEYRDGGEIRSVFIDPWGTKESVACHNLLAIISRFSTDMNRNRFGAYFVVPFSFWTRMLYELKNYHGIDPNILQRTADGGYLNVIADCCVYVGDTGERILMYSLHNGLTWKFRVTDSHELLNRPQIRRLVGKNKGFDDIVLAFPGGDGRLYLAPRSQLELWAGEGYYAALDEIAKQDQLPPGEVYEKYGIALPDPFNGHLLPPPVAV